jgi:hypothetical protein
MDNLHPAHDAAYLLPVDRWGAVWDAGRDAPGEYGQLHVACGRCDGRLFAADESWLDRHVAAQRVPVERARKMRDAVRRYPARR